MSIVKRAMDSHRMRETEEECKRARASIIKRLKELNPPLWQSCPICGKEFQSKGQSYCVVCSLDLGIIEE